MTKPWPMSPSVVNGPGWWDAHDDMHVTHWDNEQSARRYAALPVLIATIRDACNEAHCLFCDRHEHRMVKHRSDCPGIAALKAAGEAVE